MSNKHHHDKPADKQRAEQNVEEKKLEHPSYEQLEQDLNKAEAKANDHWNAYLRAKADLDNAHRRSERDVANAHKYGLEKIVTDLLAVVDSIERGLSIGSQQDMDKQALLKSVHEGMEITLKMLLRILEKYGVKQIASVGEPFNPELHQAVSMKKDSDAAANTVLEVLQNGYMLNDRLLRPAMVVVAKD